MNPNQPSLFASNVREEPQVHQDEPTSNEIQSPAPIEPSKSLPEDVRRLVIRASAGTGKTFQLTNRFIALLRESPVDSILASTFTRKAAGEILERILLRLAQASLDPKELKLLSQFIPGKNFSKQECLEILSDVTRHLHRMRISTLDGFFARLAGSFSLELGLPPGWRMMEDLEANDLRDHAIELVLSRNDVSETIQLMNLLDKGRSSRRVHDLVLDKINTFYTIFRRSDKEVWDRFPDVHFLKPEARESIIQQIKTFPLSNGNHIRQRDNDVEKMLGGNWGDLVTAGMMKAILGGGTYYGLEIDPELVALYEQILEHIRADIVVPWRSQTAATWNLLNDYHQVSERLKQETKGLTFEDVSIRLADSLKQHATERLAYRLDASIEHVLLDEFQDTAPIQWQVIRPFAMRTCERDSTSFFCVGDTKQAIYGWRGGEAAIFDAIQSELPGVEDQPLNKSFRSSQTVIDTVNRLFRGIGRHDSFDVHLLDVVQKWSREFPEHETAKTELPGYSRLEVGPVPPNFVAGETQQGKVDDCLWRRTAEIVAEQRQKAPEHTVAVLTRTNKSVGRVIFELNRLGIDASEEAGSPLNDSAAVLAVMALMKMVDHPGDTIARFHVAKSPLGELMEFTQWQDDQAAHQFATKMRLEIAQNGFGQLIHKLTSDLAPHCSPRDLKRLMQLSEQADNFDSFAMGSRISRFIHYIETCRVDQPTDSYVRVMNVHQSKGLEFDTVILPELDSEVTRHPSYLMRTPIPGEPPDVVALSRAHHDIEVASTELKEAYEQTTARAMEESLCLLYVALTRAVHNLHIVIRPRNAKEAESHLPKTFAGLVRAGLAPERELEPGATLFELGDPNWFDKTGDEESPDDQPQTPAQPKSIQFADRQGSRRLQKVVPSQEEGSRFIRLSDVLPRGNSAAMDRGTLFHRWMEQIRWLDEARPADTVLRQIGRELGHDQSRDSSRLNLEKSLTQFQSMIRVPQVAWALSKRSYLNGDLEVPPSVQAEIQAEPINLEVINERPFSVLADGRIISGTIDRLVLLSRNWQLVAADVVDFKTDAMPDDPQEIEDKIEHYRGQLEAYVRAVSKIYHLPVNRISARLILLNLGRVESVRLDSNRKQPVVE